MVNSIGTRIRFLALACALTACSQSRGSVPQALRSSAAPMAYDSARHVAVVFQGRKDGQEGETWEWDGATWTLRATGGPTSREGHAMAYDSTRGVTVLFGGFEGSGVKNNETWEWDGSTWTLRTPVGTSPTPRYGHAMAFDSARGMTVLFGGIAGAPGQQQAPNSDTWEWDGTRWRQRTAGPSARLWHALAYDSTRHVTVLFGGQGVGTLGDTWEWSGTRWTQRTPPQGSPSPRTLHAMAYDSARGATILFGGYDGAMNNETWEWDGTAWGQEPPDQLAPRAAHALAYDSERSVTVLFGGVGHENETWEWIGTAWLPTPIPPSAPPAFHMRAFGLVPLDEGHNASLQLDVHVVPH